MKETLLTLPFVVARHYHEGSQRDFSVSRFLKTPPRVFKSRFALDRAYKDIVRSSFIELFLQLLIHRHRMLLRTVPHKKQRPLLRVFSKTQPRQYLSREIPVLIGGEQRSSDPEEPIPPRRGKVRRMLKRT